MKPSHPFLQTLLLAALLNTIGPAGQGQSNVYTLNVVGYVNVTLTANRYYLICNPLDTTNNTLNTVIVSVPEGSRVWTWDVTLQRFLGPSEYDPAIPAWTIDYPVPIGKGFMFYAPANGTITFVGSVLQGALTNAVVGANKLSLLGSMVPQAGGLSGALQYPASDGDTISQYSTPAQQYPDTRSYYSGYGWYANEPTLAVAEGFFVRHPGPDTNWVRNFTVNLAAGTSPPTVVEPAPTIEGFSIRDAVVTLKVSKETERYNVQFSTDRVNWTNIAVNQTAATWQGPLPPGPAGFFQVVQP